MNIRTILAALLATTVLSACIGSSADPAMPPEPEPNTPTTPGPVGPNCQSNPTACL